MDFRPRLDVAYVIGEINGTIEVFVINGPSLPRIQAISTLPNGVTDLARAADIHVSPDGR